MNRSLLKPAWLLLPLAWLASVACAAQPQSGAVPADAGATASRSALLLLLPSQTGPFAAAGEALRAGFFAAHKVGGESVALQVIELDAGGAPLAAALASARERGVGMVVGPLPRAAVNEIVEGQLEGPPLLALNFPDIERAAPASMLAMALSLESEAQRVCRVALSQFVAPRSTDTRPRIAVVTRPGGLERRIAQAYMQALRNEGEAPLLIEWTPAAAAAVARELGAPTLEAVFLALGARDAAQMRALIPRQVQIFGTSQLYIGDPRNSPDAATLAHDLEGVRFVEMPWFLEPDHSGVMVYPQPASPLPADLARLYALGIDAYRLAIVWMKGDRRFDIDGVTGRLRVDRTRSLRVERTPLLAVYRGGAIQRLDVAR